MYSKAIKVLTVSCRPDCTASYAYSSMCSKISEINQIIITLRLFLENYITILITKYYNYQLTTEMALLDAKMIREICGVKLKDKLSCFEMKQRL